MATAKEVFAALPHVDEVWITEDGNHYLHPDNGGKKVSRGKEAEEIKEPAPIAKSVKK